MKKSLQNRLKDLNYPEQRALYDFIEEINKNISKENIRIDDIDIEMVLDKNGRIEIYSSEYQDDVTLDTFLKDFTKELKLYFETYALIVLFSIPQKFEHKYVINAMNEIYDIVQDDSCSVVYGTSVQADKSIKVSAIVNRKIKEYITAHKYTLDNKNDIKKSRLCGCCYCLKIFDMQDVVDFLGGTAICPNCSIDAVLPDKNVKITGELLKNMQNYWF